MERNFRDWGANIIGLVAVVIVNAMASGIPLGGQTTGEISARYPSLFTPAGYAFAIWGLIYLALLAYVVYQALPAQRLNVRLARISKPWLASCAFNIAWIFLWHFNFLVLSLVAMIGILVSLIIVYKELGIALSPASTGRKLFVHLPFSIYTGWIAVATIANLSAVQTGRGWDDLLLSATAWTLLKLGVAGAVAATLVCQRRDSLAALVIAWATWAIAIKQADNAAVAGAAQALVVAVLLLVALDFVRRIWSQYNPMTTDKR